MSATENIELLRAWFAAFSQGVVQAPDFVAPDYTYTIRGRAAFSGVYHGWDEIARVLDRIKDLSAGTMAHTPEVVLADDDNIMMYARITGSRPDGRTYDSYETSLYRFKSGIAVEGQAIPVDQQAFAEFWA